LKHKSLLKTIIIEGDFEGYIGKEPREEYMAQFIKDNMNKGN